MERIMLLVYWENDREVTKYKDLEDFMFGREAYHNVRMATELSIVNGEIKATHYDADEIAEFAREAERYERS